MLAQKIKEIRMAKGYSQEELAERSKLNIRTIQRVENNETEPRGKTLQLICTALGTSTEKILDFGSQKDKIFMIYYHLSVLVSMAIPFGNLILPFILWVTQKDRIKDLKQTGKPLLNFQIVWSILIPLCVIVPSMEFFMKNKSDNLETSVNSISTMLLIVLSLTIVNFLLAIIFAFRIYRGKNSFITYPSLIPFLR